MRRFRTLTGTGLFAIGPLFAILAFTGCDSPTLPRLPPPIEEEDTGDVEEGMRALRYGRPGEISALLTERADMPFTSPAQETK